MSDQSCDSIYSAYGGRSLGYATFIGTFNGLAGLIGAGSFWSPTDDSALVAETSKAADLSAAWTNILNDKKQCVIDTQRQFAQKQIDLYQVITQFNEEVMNEKISSNTLLIQILFGITLLVIIYLMIL